MDLEELKKQPYEVIADKTLANQDHLFKLIIIGDTGKPLMPRCGQELSPVKGHGQRIQGGAQRDHRRGVRLLRCQNRE